MELIEFEKVHYGDNLEEIPHRGKVFCNPDNILMLETARRRGRDGKEATVFVVRLRGGDWFNVSERCFNRIVGKEEMKLPPGPDIYPEGDRTERPDINYWEPFKMLL